jgi:hypothetical protein
MGPRIRYRYYFHWRTSHLRHDYAIALHSSWEAYRRRPRALRHHYVIGCQRVVRSKGQARQKTWTAMTSG